MVTMRFLIALPLTAALVAPAFARESRRVTAAAPTEIQDVLAAEAAGLVDVKFIPNDSRSAQVIVTNRSDRPLSLRLPAGFAGVPVLAQVQPQPTRGFAGAGQAQAVGGGGAGAQGQVGGGMGGGGPFSLPPERTRTLRVATVCLDHGKREPSPRVPYRMTAIDTCSSDPRLQDVMTALASGAISQKVAQAAAWHISSGRTWEQLAAEAISMAGGDPDVPLFTPAELAVARRLVDESAKRHQTASSESSPG